jgi:hypothetical protein
MAEFPNYLRDEIFQTKEIPAQWLQWRLGYNSYNQLHLCHGQMTFLKWVINGYYTYQNESQWCHGHTVHALTMAHMTITLDLIRQQYVQLFPFFIFWMFFSSFENIVWPGEHWNQPQRVQSEYNHIMCNTL